jgi:AcrR family transcriptional regulator
MDTRSAAVEETRDRIIEATMELHDEQGISGTSMQDIAERAGVALATVYRHFPTLDDLVPACGGRNLELNPPPTRSAFENLESGEARIAALVKALHANYARGIRTYEVGFAEAVALPVVAGFMNEFTTYIAGLVAEAAKPFEPDTKGLSLATGLCHFHVWRSLTQAGLSSEATTESVVRMICTWLTEGTTKKRGGA